jgi:hypothetical protein
LGHATDPSRPLLRARFGSEVHTDAQANALGAAAAAALHEQGAVHYLET